MTTSLAAQLSSSLRATPEQQAIVEAMPRPESQMIQAYAGTAKTTTLVMAAQQVKGPALALAFNKKIADELKAKLPSNFSVKTLNALGYAAWRAARPTYQVTVEPELRGKIIKEVLQDADLRDKEAWSKTKDLVAALQALGCCPPGLGEPITPLTKQLWEELARRCWIDKEELLAYGEAALEVLRRSLASGKAGKLASFDDQLWLPLCFGGKWPKFPLVLGDEVQDWNRLNHELVARVLKPGAKLVLAGDQLQSLYAFRGALGNSMTQARKLAPSWLDQQLTLTFRCPQVVVERQQQHAPGYKASELNRKGQVLAWNWLAEGGDVPESWWWQDFEALFKPAALPAAVLCRNNAPLLRLCLQLLRRGIKTSFLGKDLGKGLVTLAKKICGKAQSKQELRSKVLAWQEKELAGLEEEGAQDAVLDRADCLLAVIDTPGLESAQALVASLEALMGQEGACQLASIHRAKGLEWDVVMLLDPWRIPRKGAKGEALQQEMNCKYVAETRTKDVLVLANLADLTWEEANGNS